MAKDVASQSFDYRVRPVRSGASISHRYYERGTACALVTRTRGVGRGRQYILSCQHVLFPNFRYSYRKSSILQPALSSFREPQEDHVVARQYYHAGIDVLGVNEVDAAIGLLKSSRYPLMTNSLMDSGFGIRGWTDSYTVGDPVEAYGAVSGKQFGVIEDLFDERKISYDCEGVGPTEISFRNIVKCRYESRKGDSGAPVLLERNKKLIGMHFAGGGGYGYFCRISRVFEKLGIDLV